MSILQMSISASLLVVAIVIIRFAALNRLPKTMFLILWGIVLFRLLIPVSIPSPFSVYTALDSICNQIAPKAVIPIIETALPIGDAAIKDTAETITADANAATNAIVGTEWDAPIAQNETSNITPTVIIWLAGMLAAFIFFAVMYYKNHRELRYAMPIRDNDFLNSWLAEHKSLRSITIMQSDRITTPVAIGLIRSRIILPISMNLDDEQLLGYVLAHEYCHIRRFDTFWKLLFALALCVHWFNPFAWIMYILATRDIELSCDEAVLSVCGENNKTNYALTLILWAEQRSRLTPLYNNFSKNSTEERIVSIMKMKKNTLIVIISSVVVVVGIATLFATSAAPVSKETVDNNSISPPLSLSSITQAAYEPPSAVTVSIPEGYKERMYFVSKGDSNLKVTYDGQTWEENDAVLEDEYWEWYTYEGYEEYATAILAQMDAKDPKTAEMAKFQYAQTLMDIKNGIKVARPKQIFVMESGPQFTSTDNTSDIIRWHCFSYSFKDKAGNAVNLGLFETRDQLFAVLKQYYEQEVATGNLNQDEADSLYNNIAHSTREVDEIPLREKLLNYEPYLLNFFIPT